MSRHLFAALLGLELFVIGGLGGLLIADGRDPFGRLAGGALLLVALVLLGRLAWHGWRRPVPAAFPARSR